MDNSPLKKLAAAVLLGVAAIPILLWFLSARVELAVEPELRVVGIETPVTIRVNSPYGIRRMTVIAEQDGKRHVMQEERREASRLLFWRQDRKRDEFTVIAGQSRAPELHNGKARLIVEAESNDLRARITAAAFEIEVNTAPPRVTADSFQHYINQGGAELVVFTPGGYWTDAGVKVGPHTFRSYPLPGAASGDRFALFAFSWDVPATTQPTVFASNPGGAEATATFWHKVFPKAFRKRKLEVSDAFMQKVVPQIGERTEIPPGSLLDRFLWVNRQLRLRNNATLYDLRLKTEERFLWSEPFVQLSNSKVESHFADQRSYAYNGRVVDEQVHLGFDLSVTEHVGVTAANSGKVVFAGDLGIYGNCVVVDHGYGLQSIYAHLSGIDVKEGDMVERRQRLGRSGATGLAGGDHLHFSMQIDGVQVNPVEWWDAHWIQDRIRTKVPLVAQAQ
ncbi:MAG: peptidoglycan DD-metalloendopeptidase family protein [Bryobacterales bacterium]|nr:peptidoglycan DD-metalloendopeptidase family protein [Bryobacterales bacterium]